MTASRTPDHYIRHEDIDYGRAPCRGEQVPLRLDLNLPRRAPGPVPLVVWIHGGGFSHGDKSWAGHRTDARWLTRAGYGCAAINYRLRASKGDLSAPVSERVEALQQHRLPWFRKGLSGAPALAAMEDALTALAWLMDNRDRFGLSGWVALGGNSAGAITAFNVAHLSGFFGLSRPAIRGIVSISGGFAYPDLYAPAMVPVHALHNPADPRVDIAAIRAVAERGGPWVELVEAPEQEHGRVRLFRDEPAREAYGRILRFLDRERASA